MKVLHLVHSAWPETDGGIQLYLRDLLRSQRRAGLRVVLLSGSMEVADRPRLDRVERDGVPGYRVHRDDHYFDHYAKIYHPATEELVAGVLAAERPDVVHVHHWLMLTCNLVELAARAGVPALVTLHDAFVTCPRCYRVARGGAPCRAALGVGACTGCVPRYGHEDDAEVVAGVEAFAGQLGAELSGAAAVLVATQSLARLVEREHGVPSHRLHRLPLGYCRRLTGAPPPRPAGPPRFGYWGSLAPQKGTVVLLEACRQLVENGVALELRLFGPARPASFETEVVAALDRLPARWVRRCALAEVAAAGLDLAVLPSLCFETFSYVLEEAFELGLPCVVSDAGALAERAGAAGLVVAAGDAAALAAALKRWLTDGALRRRLRQAVSARAPAVDMDLHAAALASLYATATLPRQSAEPARGRWLELLVRQRESALRALGARPQPPE